MSDWRKIVLMVSAALAAMLFMTTVNQNLRHRQPSQTRMGESSTQ
jgi:hypothetical protein